MNQYWAAVAAIFKYTLLSKYVKDTGPAPNLYDLVEYITGIRPTSAQRLIKKIIGPGTVEEPNAMAAAGDQLALVANEVYKPADRPEEWVSALTQEEARDIINIVAQMALDSPDLRNAIEQGESGTFQVVQTNMRPKYDLTSNMAYGVAQYLEGVIFQEEVT